MINDKIRFTHNKIELHADHEPSIGNISRYTCKYINPSISKYPIAQSMAETKMNIYIYASEVSD